MKKLVFIFLALATMTGCKKRFEGNSYAKLNGYWEIEKVVLPDGTEKDYGANPTIDYLEVKDTAGFRKKAMPQIDGTYRANDLSESFTIKRQGDSVVMHYTTPYAQWDETLLSADDKELVVKNQHQMEYHYKKSEPFTLK
ncbi:lipocalin family protein [Flavobacterium sp. RHBU_3]|uniref:lipocalin family protein n=1 Tax=Flavobacterium sp. RHBU_3 TaxID=3391184 RepID=UPI003984D9E2